MAFLEEIIHDDAQFPIIFHTDTSFSSAIGDGAHWHRKLEVLCTLEGDGFTLIDGSRVSMAAEDIILIPPNSIHVTRAEKEQCRYHCLIIDQDFLTDRGILKEDERLPMRLRDTEGFDLFQQIQQEMYGRPPCYKELVMALVTQLMIGLRRRHLEDGPVSSLPVKGGHLETVRKAIAVIDREFGTVISLDRLCQTVGLSKYYFCRAFKQATGQTVTGYINWVRCDRAHRLLTSGQCNVGEAAERCGFHNLSYFTKVYHRQYGHTPSQEKRTVQLK